ncbi:hypothetical protein TRFO_23865 [Tritrichomonas foetus]|uniref:Uncharacterized protein n=1 Tax=Tritrichomonas foetus TaxID=1144522 RepID=A0A1J4K8T4_9EUKA|nr:hypothetical protein TRFO_23865 [Tritrichomonas foetus]|eukprot:OHT07823.1 hypothetical protein TRFO_23865 [Tritrichomonas foetus]
MKTTRFSLQDIPSAQATSLENILQETNNEYNKEYKSLTEREAKFYNQKKIYQSSLRSSKKRIKNLVNYSNELELKHKMIESNKESLQSQFEEANNNLDVEISINENTLERLQHENELLIQKYQYYKLNSIQLHSKLDELENIEKNLNERVSNANKQIAQSEASAPKRLPEKIKNEISILSKNIPEVNKKIDGIEDNIVQKELRKIKLQTETSNLKEKSGLLRIEMAENYQKGDVKNESIRNRLSTKLERLSTVEASQTEKVIILNNLKNTVVYQSQKNKKLNKLLKKSYQKVEDMKDLVAQKHKDKQITKQKIEETKEATDALISRRLKNESNKTEELYNIREEFRKLQKKCGAESYKADQIKLQKTELKEINQKLESLLVNCKEETDFLKIERKEIEKLAEKVLDEKIEKERQYKMDLITLDDITKRIGQEQLMHKQLLDDRMQFLSFPKIEQPKEIEFPELKKSIKSINLEIEALKFECTKRKHQKSTSKQEILLKKVDLEHTKNLLQYLQHEKESFIEKEEEEKLIKLRMKKYENESILKKIEDKQNEILNRKNDLQILQNHLKELSKTQRVTYFGNNVALVVSHDFPRFQQSHTIDEFNIEKVVGFDKLVDFYRRIQIEHNIWNGCVKEMTISGILETWNDEIQRYV